MIKISPSVLASDFSRLGEEVLAMDKAGADMIHLDVMDGVFVPNMSFGMPLIKAIRPCSNIFFDAHLMIVNPYKYIQDFADAGCDGITFHCESEGDINTIIQEIRRLKMSAAMSLKPATPAQSMLPYLDKLDMVLVMTVEPGFGGQSFMHSMLTKIEWFKAKREELGLSYSIQVDGGINNDTAKLACASGADNLVAGSSLFSQPDYAQAIARLRESAQGQT